MPIIPDYPLQSHNTLAVSATALYFASVTDEGELVEAVKFAAHRDLPLMVIGEGSNIVFADDFPGLVIKNNINGIDVIEECEDYSLVRAGAGVIWQDLVKMTLDFHLWGLENLTDIPGTVGAAPVQNIGAYGVELERFFVELRALDVKSRCVVTFDKAGCGFGYRDSVFKGRFKGRYIILSVTLKLAHEPNLVIDYAPLQQRLQTYLSADSTVAPQIDTHKEIQVTPPLVAQVISQIRQEKIPHPGDIPNAGSFFKNPIISDVQFEELERKFPTLVYYPYGENKKKLAAGWLIDQAGWKGFEEGGVGVHKDQALVIINSGRRSGAVVLALADKIQQSINKMFGVQLEIEPMVVLKDTHASR